MKVYMFHSGKNHEMYGFTPDKNGANLPADLAPWTKHSELDVNLGEPPRTGVPTEDILDGIKRDGFLVAGVRITVTEKIVANPPKK
jgi:hypothetical protein